MMSTGRFRRRYAAHLGFRSFDIPLFRNAARSTDPVDQIRFAAEIGLAGVLDPWILTRAPGDRARIARAIRETGLQAGTVVASLQSELRTPLWLPRDAESERILENRLSDAIAAAAAIGSTTIGVVTGLHADMAMAAQEALFVKALGAAAERAADSGMVLALEAINPRGVPGMLISSFAQCERLVRETNHPAVRIMYDTAHLQATEGDLVGHFQRAADIIAVIQIANHPGRTEPARGEINMRHVLSPSSRAATTDSSNSNTCGRPTTPIPSWQASIG